MRSPSIQKIAAPLEATPAQLAELLPGPGEWTEEAYLWLTDATSRLVELSDGHLEVLPMPTDRHQVLIARLFSRVDPWIRSRGGLVLFAALRLYLAPKRYREPDLLLLLDAKDPRRHDRYWHGADLVVEVVSDSNRSHDLVVKRAEYAEAGIPEYWIVDPEAETVIVLALFDRTYREHGIFGRGEIGKSRLLAGFEIDMDGLFDAD